MRILVSAAIRFYQKFISPYKGFRCAYGVYHGGSSCSAEVLHIVRSTPLLEWWPRTRNQFHQCKSAYAMLDASKKKKRRIFKRKSERNRWYDCCDCSAACDIFDLGKIVKNCDATPDIGCCDCSP